MWRSSILVPKHINNDCAIYWTRFDLGINCPSGKPLGRDTMITEQLVRLERVSEIVWTERASPAYHRITNHRDSLALPERASNKPRRSGTSCAGSCEPGNFLVRVSANQMSAEMNGRSCSAQQNLSNRYGQDSGNRRSRSLRVLVADDAPSMRHMPANYLAKHNIRVVSASQRHDVIPSFAAGEPDIGILDIRLGQEDGFDLLREIRSRSDVPVIIITGDRRDEIDRVVGLQLGADDYVTKPFGVRELLARIHAVLRRHLDRRARRLTDPNGAPVALTKSEYALLTAFLDAPQRPLTGEYLLQATRVHEDIFDRSIDVQILRLRRKLVPRIVKTERGVGDKFTLPVESLGWSDLKRSRPCASGFSSPAISTPSFPKSASQRSSSWSASAMRRLPPRPDLLRPADGK
jgi:two-component system OmpR family response regulator